jgi:hypothetical protein
MVYDSELSEILPKLNRLTIICDREPTIEDKADVLTLWLYRNSTPVPDPNRLPNSIPYRCFIQMEFSSAGSKWIELVVKDLDGI